MKKEIIDDVRVWLEIFEEDLELILNKLDMEVDAKKPQFIAYYAGKAVALNYVCGALRLWLKDQE